MNKIITCYLTIIVLIVVTILTGCKKEKVPVIETSFITNITATTATFSGSIIDEGSSAVISRGVCWSSRTSPSIADSKTSDGAGAGNFSSNLTGLKIVTVYYVRAYATNKAGTGYGVAISFTTKGQSPTPMAATPTNLNVTNATLNGSVNANYLSTDVTFEYGTTTDYGSSITATQSPITGDTSTSVTADITGLLAGTTYHYRITAVNSLGTTHSDDIIFTTLGQVPTVITFAATNINVTSSTLNGSVNANYLATIATFEYGTTTSYGSTITASQSPVTGFTNTNISANVAALTPGKTYHYRIKTENSLGTSYGSDLTFTTLGQVPIVTTLAATNISPYEAQLNGTINANYLESTITFQYGIDVIDTANSITATLSPVTGNTNTNVSASITGLVEGKTYHYRIVATNSLGTTYGNEVTFKAVHVIGGIEFGGFIFYIDATGKHGLVCAPIDQSINAPWGCAGTNISGANGNGHQNTLDIIKGCSTAGIAAKICSNLNLDGYSDWYLPSKDELSAMYNNLASQGLGDFSVGSEVWYWSSTQFDNNQAWSQNFTGGNQSNSDYKNYGHFVRAIRAF